METTTDKFGQIKQAKVIDKNALNNFVLWADENNQPANATGYKKMVKGQHWESQQEAVTINQPSQTREGLIVPTNLDGGDIDMSDFINTYWGAVICKIPLLLPNSFDWMPFHSLCLFHKLKPTAKL